MRYQITTTNGTFYASDLDFPELADLVAAIETRAEVPACRPGLTGGIDPAPIVVVFNSAAVVSIVDTLD